MADNSLEAKICVLGAQGVGKTSLVERYVKGTFSPRTTLSTVGASFLTKRTTDVDSGTVVRLQIWDTAGQERFRSISQLYYRGASAVILVYSILDEFSFNEMGRWLDEVRQQLSDDIVIHVVGTKTDVVAEDPSRRTVPFERCIAYVAERLHPTRAATPRPTAGCTPNGITAAANGGAATATELAAVVAERRQSGFWVQDVGWDDCHEISASSGEGIEEVFRVVTRKLVERRLGRVAPAHPDTEDATGARCATARGLDSRSERSDTAEASLTRAGVGDKRRSWLSFPVPTPAGDEGGLVDITDPKRSPAARCC